MGCASQLLTARVEPGAEERPLGDPRVLDVLRDRFGRGEMEPDAAVLVALLVERDGRLVAVLMEVPDPEATRGADSGTAVEEEFQDRPVTEVEDRVAGGQPHELPGTRCREGLGLVARVGRAPGDELSVRRIGNRYRPPSRNQKPGQGSCHFDVSIFAPVKSELESRPSRSQMPSASANDTSRRRTFSGVTNAIEPDHASGAPGR